MMQIYLVIDEEKKGPFTLFQVEEQLRDGTLSDDQLAWYDGEGEWKALRELPPFETFFRRRDVELEDERRLKVAERHAEVQRERAETLPRINVRPWTRFWARNLDWWFFFVFCLVLMLGMRAIGWIDTSMEGFMTVFSDAHAGHALDRGLLPGPLGGDSWQSACWHSRGRCGGQYLGFWCGATTFPGSLCHGHGLLRRTTHIDHDARCLLFAREEPPKFLGRFHRFIRSA